MLCSYSVADAKSMRQMGRSLAAKVASLPPPDLATPAAESDRIGVAFFINIEVCRVVEPRKEPTAQKCIEI